MRTIENCLRQAFSEYYEDDKFVEYLVALVVKSKGKDDVYPPEILYRALELAFEEENSS